MNKDIKALRILTIIMIACLIVMGIFALLSSDPSPYRTQYALLAFSMIPIHLNRFIRMSTEDDEE